MPQQPSAACATLLSARSVRRLEPWRTRLLTRTARLIWAVLLGAQVVYVLVGFLQHGAAGRALADNRVFPLTLGLITVIQLGAAHLFWRRASGAGRSLHDPSRPTAAAAITSYIIAWVLDESVAIYGLVLALLGLPVGIWLVFSAVAALAMILHHPKEPAA